MSKVTVQAKAGNDVVTYSSDADLTVPVVIVIDLGTGNDSLKLDLSDGGGNGINDDLTITVLAGAGNDDVDIALGPITDSNVDSFADLAGDMTQVGSDADHRR